MYGRCCSVTTWCSHCKVQLIVRILRTEFITSVSCTLFCGGNFSCAMKLCILPPAMLENNCLDLPWICFGRRVCPTLQIHLDVTTPWQKFVPNEGFIQAGMCLESLFVQYDPQSKVNIVLKQNVSEMTWWPFGSLAKKK